MALYNDLSYAIDHWASALGWPTESLCRLVLAALLGGLIGLEREVRGHEAGLRTHLLVCLGCAVAMIVSLSFARVDWATWPTGTAYLRIDPARVAYGVMGGVGFLGAGTIMHTRGLIRGLTSAAGIWCTAALGLAVGMGLYTTAVITTVLVFFTLVLLRKIEPMFPNRQGATLVIAVREPDPNVLAVRDYLEKLGFAIKQIDLERDPRDDHWLVTVLCHHFEPKFESLFNDLKSHDKWNLHGIKRMQQ